MVLNTDNISDLLKLHAHDHRHLGVAYDTLYGHYSICRINVTSLQSAAQMKAYVSSNLMA